MHLAPGTCTSWIFSIRSSLYFFQFQQFIFSLTPVFKYRNQEILLVKKLRQRKLSISAKVKLFPECVMKHCSVMIKARKLKKLHHLGKLHPQTGTRSLCTNSELEIIFEKVSLNCFVALPHQRCCWQVGNLLIVFKPLWNYRGTLSRSFLLGRILCLL